MKNIILTLLLTTLTINAQITTVPEIAASTNETEIINVEVLKAYISQRDSEQTSAVLAKSAEDLVELNRVKQNYLTDRAGLISDNQLLISNKLDIINAKSIEIQTLSNTIISNNATISELNNNITNLNTIITNLNTTITNLNVEKVITTTNLENVTKERDDVIQLRDNSANAYIAIRDGLLASTEIPDEIKQLIMSQVTPLEQFVIIAKTPAEILKLQQLEADAAAKVKAKQDLETTITEQQAEIAALKAKLGQ